VERHAKTAAGAGLWAGPVLENVVVGKRKMRKSEPAAAKEAQLLHGINTGAGKGCGKAKL